ncbi:hypothetical protein TWF970_008731 [Orbilia oligospora]|uniref:F-box domain-containing protein n=1 Tax=Orbilia oligospora TaxID=2813651 RepID=A0A7C8VL65_ORBOL|nr:hypothetical protein TWF970_008731 [Orbilia oligospora]
MPPQYSKPAVFLPFDILHLICRPLTQSDRLAFLRTCRSWYTAGYTLILTSMDFKTPVIGELPKYSYNRRWKTHESLDLLPKTLHITDPVRKIYSGLDTRLDRLFDTITRLNRDLPSIFPVPVNLLANVRNVRINCQLIDIPGRHSNSYGVTHTWAFNLIPHILMHCPMLDDMEVKVKCALYNYPVIQYPHDMGILMPINSGTNQMQLRNSGGVDVSGNSWISNRNWAEFFWMGFTEEWKGKRRERGLSRFSITLAGRSLVSTAFVFRNVWYILHTMDMLDRIDELEVRDFHYARLGQYCSPSWLIMAIPGYIIEASGLQFKSVKRFWLECGEHQTCAFNSTASQILKTTFPNLESLSIAKLGLFLQKDFGFLDSLPNIKRLSITEKSSLDLENDESPDSMHSTNLLVDCMELLLHPPGLQMIEWNRGGYQRARCDITWGNSKQIQFVDIWLTIGGEKVLAAERYDGWYFREELFYGMGSESKWGELWARRFVQDSRVVAPFEFEGRDRDEEMHMLSDGPPEAIPW